MRILILLLVVNIIMSGLAIYAGRRREKELNEKKHDITLAQFERVYDALIENFGEEYGTKMVSAWVITMECLGKIIIPLYSRVQNAIDNEIAHGPNGLFKTLHEIATPELFAKLRFDKELAKTVTTERVAKLHKMRNCLY